MQHLSSKPKTALHTFLIVYNLRDSTYPFPLTPKEGTNYQAIPLSSTPTTLSPLPNSFDPSPQNHRTPKSTPPWHTGTQY